MTSAHALAAAIVLASVSAAGAASACEADFVGLPNLSHGVAAWEARNGARLTPEARAGLAREACRAVRQVSVRAGAPESDIDREVGPMMAEYLDSVLEPGASTDGLEARFASAFILGAEPEPPKIKSLGRVRISYSQQVDDLLVGARLLPPHTLLIAETGPLSIAGRRRAAVICRANLNVTAGVEARFSC